MAEQDRAILMFRMLVLQALNNLSDEQVEYQVRDRLSFSRFFGARDRGQHSGRHDAVAVPRVGSCERSAWCAKIGLQNLAYNIRRLVTLERLATA
jgi:Transposase domain (DUF772)